MIYSNAFIKPFNDELKKYEKENSLKFSNDVKIKLADSYASTILIEKDITPKKWLKENMIDILNIYKDEIFLKK